MPRIYGKLIRSRQFAFKGVFVSNYIPRRCGLATYTKDLTNAVNILNPDYLSEIMALTDEREPVEYPWEVKYQIRREKEADYIRAAEYLNRSSCDYVSIQHEYGIFGGNYGEYVLSMLRHLKKPVVTTFHTTLENPNNEQKYILQKIAGRSKACVVMINEAMKRLRNVYGIPKSKIVVIHHGVPDIPFSPSKLYKPHMGFKKDEFLIGSINLIAPNKGLEYVIQALPEIRKAYRKVKFIMIGQTHPLVKLNQGEIYRESLHTMAKKLKVDDSFVEINEYLSLEDLCRYLQALDVYITPYNDLNATSSGTLAYALGAGKVCVSTPYIYAKETLDKGRGIFIKPKHPESISKEVIGVIQDKKKRKKIEESAYAFGRKMVWSRVALDYLNLFSYVLNGK